ncbi:MFS transporter [Nocardioides mangrovi]|uniref:MFS transporter n=1 Tax=Nocardioides mangrovi TaxID=2874580 RepID=A0ABS7UKQ0_9ACTN|nr:MFS transporter [Nocardioides mangrovi]MBZ5741335.1 MFS transporter [Nocardioides mangrovi]
MSVVVRDRLALGWLLVKGLSDAGDALWTVAVAWTAVHVASPAVAGLVVAAGTLPRAVVLLLGGVVADRLEARWVMLVVNLARIAVLVATSVWVLTAGTTVPVLVVAAVAFGVCDAVYEPSAATIGRQLVAPDQLPAYTGAGQTISRLGSMGGAAVGGLVVATWGLGGGAVANAVTFAIVVGYLAVALRPRYPLPRAEAEPVLRGVARGFAHLRDESTTRTLVLTLSGLNLAVSPALALGVALRAQDGGWGAGAVGLMQALVGLGAAAGAATLLRWRPTREAVVGFWLLVLQGVAIAGIGVGTVVTTALACTVIGVTAGAASSLLGATFTALVDGEYLGRMVAITRLGDDVLMPLAMALFGLLAGSVGVTAACAAYGLAMAGAMAVPLSRPVIRGLSLRAAPDLV